MYEQFGVTVDGTSKQENGTRTVFRLFFPDADFDHRQYIAAGPPRIRTARVVGTFQPTGEEWNINKAPIMVKNTYPDSGNPIGYVFEYECYLMDNFYEYKYLLEFENGTKRWCSDPCTKYGGKDNDNSAFVVGGSWPAPKPLANRMPLKDLIIYELMIGDFAEESDKAPIDAVLSKLKYLQDELGINAIAFMPWTAWTGHDFSWGYNPSHYFSVENRYTQRPGEPLEKLALLRNLINDCHERGIHVIMDGVFNHAETCSEGSGFPYYWLYQDTFDSPYVGTFAGGGFFKNLDFNNECTHQFIFDVCKYWIEEFAIDGIRFDYSLGFYHYDDRGHGLNRIIYDLRSYLRDKNQQNFSLILEHLPDNRYEAISVANDTGATSCWYDPFLNLTMEYLSRYDESGNKHDIIDYRIMRMLNTTKDFAPGKGPVTYCCNHDHTRVIEKAGGRDKWWKIQPYLIALFTTPGTPMIYNGDEFGEDYFVPDSGSDRVKARPLHWKYRNDEIGQKIFALYQKLIDLRKKHPALRSPYFYPDFQPDWQRLINDKGYGANAEKNVVVYHRWEEDSNKKATQYYMVVLNFSNAPQEVDVPFQQDGTWEDLLSGWKTDITNRHLTFKIGSNWGHVFYAKAV